MALILRFRIHFIVLCHFVIFLEVRNFSKLITGIIVFLVTLFNFQDPRRFPQKFLSFVQRLIYYITLFFICQEFF